MIVYVIETRVRPPITRLVITKVADPLLMRIRIQLLTYMRIQIQPTSKLWESATTGLWTFQDSIVSDHGPPQLSFEFFTLMRIRIQLFYSNADPDPASKNTADPDPLPWLKLYQVVVPGTFIL